MTTTTEQHDWAYEMLLIREMLERKRKAEARRFEESNGPWLDLGGEG